MAEVRATLSITCYVECPNCEHTIDLMDGDYNEEGQVINQACPDGHWIDLHKDFSISNIECEECSTVFDASGLDW